MKNENISPVLTKVLEVTKEKATKEGFEISPLAIFGTILDVANSKDLLKSGIQDAAVEKLGVKLLQGLNAPLALMGEKIYTTITKDKNKAGRPSAAMNRVWNNMLNEKEYVVDMLDCAEFIYSALKDANNNLHSFLKGYNISYENYYAAYHNVAAPQRSAPKSGSKQCQTIELFSRNLNELAPSLDEAISRDIEIENVIKALMKRNKSNAVIVGQAGTGKTAIVETIAKRIVEGNVPPFLCDKVIYALDISRVMSGSKFRGELEQRMVSIINEAESNDKVILFIDEIHTIVGAGTGGQDNEGLDISNIMKPALARGKMKVIGATTEEEYEKTIARNGPMRRRFEKIVIEELGGQALKVVIANVLERTSAHYKVEIANDVTSDLIVKLSSYINEGHNPDKCIDIIDRAFANVAYRKQSVKDDPILTKFDIILATSRISRVPVQLLDIEIGGDFVSSATKYLNANLIGQESAKALLASAILRSRISIYPNKPKMCLYLDGPSGVGKTKAVEILTELIVGDKTKVYKIDLTSFTDANSISRLIGTSPGYIGYNDTTNNLSNFIKRNNIAIICFENIDACSPHIKEYIVSCIESNTIDDNRGNKISLANTYIFFVANTLMEDKKPLGFASAENNTKNFLRKKYGKKFIECVDEIVIFGLLSKTDLRILLEKFAADIADNSGIKLCLSDSAIDYLISGCDTAKQLKNKLSSHIEGFVYAAMVNNESVVNINFNGENLQHAKEICSTCNN